MAGDFAAPGEHNQNAPSPHLPAPPVPLPAQDEWLLRLVAQRAP